MARWIKAILEMDIFGIYSLACILLPCLIYQFVQVVKMRKAGKRCQAALFIWIYIFLIYIWMVFKVTGLGTLGDVFRQGRGSLIGEINVRPFDSLGIGYVLNIVMCIPLGFLLPFIWKKYRKLGKTVLAGFLFSMIIEVTQLFNFRATDIDDLTANTLGCLAGYGIWKIFSRIFGKYLKKPEVRNDALVYIVLAAAGTFFLYNPYLLY